MNDALDRYKALQRPTKRGVYESDTTSGVISNFASEQAARAQEMAARMEAMKRAEEESQQMPEMVQIDWANMPEQQRQQLKQQYPEVDFSQPITKDQSAQMQGSILGGKVPITQEFGRYNPGLEPNKSGRNWGVDFGVKEGTPLALPPGEWQVVQTYDKSRGRGRVGNRENAGYGNSVLVMNPKTGETMRFSHLQGVNVQPGQVVRGGTVIGKSGATGNVTGPHLDLEYKVGGQFRDVTKSPYARYLFGNNS